MRITDLAVPTPVTGARPSARRAGEHAAPSLVSTDKTKDRAHPDEVAASALARAASSAQASRVVAAANEEASASVRGELLDLARVP